MDPQFPAEVLAEQVKIQHLHQLIERQHQDKRALLHGERALSFGDLQARVLLLAGHLQCQLGFSAGERVAFFDQKSTEQVAFLFAVWYCGGVVVPINPSLKPAQVVHILKDARVTRFVSSEPRVEALALQQALPSELLSVITTDKKWQDALFTTSCSQDWPDGKPNAAHLSESDDLAALMYTSGSTGLPKGVMLSQRNLLLGAASVANYLKLADTDKVLALLPLSFDYGLNQLLSTWYVGGVVVLHNFMLPAVVGADIAQHGVSVLAGVPPLWRQILPVLKADQLKTLKLVTNSGGAFTEDLKIKIQNLQPSIRIYSMYGLTEAFRSSYLPPEKLDEKPKSVGQAIPFARLLVLDKDLRPCQPGIPGELVHAGALVAQGYWQLPEQTAQRFIELPDFLAHYPGEKAVLSGDLAYFDLDGDLYILGRRDEQIKTSGYRVSPQEVEALALTIDGVVQAACFGVPDAQLGHAIALVIQGEHASEVAVRNQYQIMAANYLWPKYILHYEELPLNANGKIDRSNLKKRVLNEICAS